MAINALIGVSHVLQCVHLEPHAAFLRAVANDRIFEDVSTIQPEIIDMSIKIAAEYKPFDGENELRAWLTGPNPLDKTVTPPQRCPIAEWLAIYLLTLLEESRDVQIARLRIVARMLHMNELDFLDEIRGGVSSWDVLGNLWRLVEGADMQVRLAERPPSPRATSAMQAIPSAWPRMQDVSPRTRSSPTSLKIWVATTCISCIFDIMECINTDPSWKVEWFLNILQEKAYCDLQAGGLCKPDPRFAEIMRWDKLHIHDDGQWYHMKKLIDDFDDTVLDGFEAYFDFGRTDDDDIIFICGHPLYWCRLFERFNHPVIGFVEQPFTLWAFDNNREKQDAWADHLVNLFRRPSWVMVGMAPFFSFQIHWSLGVQIPYARIAALQMHAKWQPTKSDIVVNSGSTAAFNLLTRMDPRFVTWGPYEHNALPASISKSDLFTYRAAVLAPYDIAQMKLLEFYRAGIPIFTSAHLWRWVMRWSQTHWTHANATKMHPTNPTRNMWSEDQNFDWAHPFSVGMDATRQNTQEGPFSTLPGSPYLGEADFPTPSRWFVHPTQACQWASLSEFALRPNITYFASFTELIAMLDHTTMDDLTAISRAMHEWQAAMEGEVIPFWRSLVDALVDRKDARDFKGADQWVPKAGTHGMNGKNEL